MKTKLIIGFWLLTAGVRGQVADSAVVMRVVDSLVQLSLDFASKQNFEKAFEINADAEKIVVETFGKESAGYSTICTNHGRLFFSRQDYPAAEKWYLEVKSIREKTLGKEHPDYAASLNNLADSYYDSRLYAKAETLYLEAKSVWEKTLPKEHPNRIIILNNLANLYVKLELPEKAAAYYTAIVYGNQTIIARRAGHLSERELERHR